MTADELKCPGCAAKLDVAHEFSRVVVCQYCGLLSKIHSGILDPTGSFARLTPSRSKISLGLTFNHVISEGVISEGVTSDGVISDHGPKKYTVLGRVRYQYDEGYWDEWWVSSDEKSGWLEEDEGTLHLYSVRKLTSKVPSFSDILVGSSIEVNGKEFFVTEKNRARVSGSEGQMPEVFLPATEIAIIDGAYDGGMGSIEYWQDEISFSTAEEVTLAV